MVKLIKYLFLTVIFIVYLVATILMFITIVPGIVMASTGNINDWLSQLSKILDLFGDKE